MRGQIAAAGAAFLAEKPRVGQNGTFDGQPTRHEEIPTFAEREKADVVAEAVLAVALSSSSVFLGKLLGVYAMFVALFMPLSTGSSPSASASQ